VNMDFVFDWACLLNGIFLFIFNHHVFSFTPSLTLSMIGSVSSLFGVELVRVGLAKYRSRAQPTSSLSEQFSS
jgi:hypothetical protein